MISVSHLTALDASPEEFVKAAAKAGFDAVGLRIVAPAHTPQQWPVAGNARRTRDLRKLADDLGIRILEAETFSALAALDIDQMKLHMEAAVELGVSVLVSAGHDPDRSRLIDEYGQIAGAAAPFGLTVGVEFMPFRPLATLGEARDVIAKVGLPNMGVLIDTLHLSRSGGTLEEVRSMERGEIAYIHLCDAVAELPSPENFVVEARNSRLYPGQGDLRLGELLCAIPDDVPITVEAPHRDQKDWSVDDRLRDAYRATSALFKTVERGFPNIARSAQARR